MNGYWKAIIQEIVNKEKLTLPIRLTNTAACDTDENESLKPIKVIRRYYLEKPYNHVYFTFQEARCLLYCRENPRYKAISQALNISERTVEFYLKNMRGKVQCKTKKDLLKISEKGNFFRRYQLADEGIELC